MLATVFSEWYLMKRYVRGGGGPKLNKKKTRNGGGDHTEMYKLT